MKKNSALRLLPTFRLQVGDANRIFAIIASFVLFCDLILLFQTEKVGMTIFMSISTICVLLAICLYVRYMERLLKHESKRDCFRGALIEYIAIVIGIAPICIYLFVDQQWKLFNKYGTECFFLFNHRENWIIPLLVFFLISYTYWLVIYNLKKESKVYSQLEKIKTEIYG